MSPGSVTEKLYFFVGRHGPSDRRASGGGNHAEGEDIEVLELSIDDALAMIRSGAIQEARRSCCCSTPPFTSSMSDPAAAETTSFRRADRPRSVGEPLASDR